MRKIIVLFLCAMMGVVAARADEGMWLPSLMGRQIKEMQKRGFKLSAEDIYSVNRASLKDAIVQFGRGCSGEVVSAEGLLLTNHHCGYGQVQSHSTIEHDYLTDGFWAMNRGEELPNPGLTVSFLVRMDDVTERVFEGVDDQMADSVRRNVIKKNISTVRKQTTEGTHFNASVEPFYYGNQYFVFVYETFRDVRLVAAPPSSIGKFGGDTDNWMWPRHTGDFSVFRIYADKNNNPADYSKENVPYRPRKHFTISTQGVKQGDFTFVYGYPGRTSQYVTSDAVDYILNVSNPAKIGLRTMRLEVINRAQAQDATTRIKYASKNAGIANAWKKWQGESRGIARLGTIEKKQKAETEFQKWALSRPEYCDVLHRMISSYAQLKDYAFATDYHNEAILAIEIVKFAGKLISEKGAAREQAVEAFYRDYVPEIDREIASLMLREYLTNVPERFIPDGLRADVEAKGGVVAYIDMLFATSDILTLEGYRGLVSKGADALSSDPVMKLYKQFNDTYKEKVHKDYVRINSDITAFYSVYMRAMMEMEPMRNFYPDANFTLRVAYGTVSGCEPADGVLHLPVSTLDGIIEKDDPSIYDYNIPQRLRDLHAAKDYGRWGFEGSVPVAFMATNHTTGGNSGSPVLNARGELVGINFDRTWLSTMSDVEFDPQMCRNIAVDIRYVLFVIDRLGGAGYLIDEMGVK